MANQPHPSKEAVTWRLHRDLLAAVRAAAKRRDQTVLALVTEALSRDVGWTPTPPRPEGPDRDPAGPPAG